MIFLFFERDLSDVHEHGSCLRRRSQVSSAGDVQGFYKIKLRLKNVLRKFRFQTKSYLLTRQGCGRPCGTSGCLLVPVLRDGDWRAIFQPPPHGCGDFLSAWVELVLGVETWRFRGSRRCASAIQEHARPPQVI